MDSRDLTEAQCFELVEPSGERQENRRTALIVSTILNLLRGKEDEAVTIDDILPMLEPQFEADEDDEEAGDPEELLEQAFAIFGLPPDPA